MRRHEITIGQLDGFIPEAVSGKSERIRRDVSTSGLRNPSERFKRIGKAPMIFPLLRYLGKISQPEYSEYGFRVENEDRSVRLLILTIENSVFLTNQLMVQEAPDLCYQKVLTDLKSEGTNPIKDYTPITASDIAQYRAFHTSPQRKSFKQPLE